MTTTTTGPSSVVQSNGLDFIVTNVFGVTGVAYFGKYCIYWFVVDDDDDDDDDDDRGGDGDGGCVERWKESNEECVR